VVNVDVGRPGFDPDAVGRAFLFSADTGRLAHVWPGVTAEGGADPDADRLGDLYGRAGGKLYAIRGTTPEVWRRPGVWLEAWPSEPMRGLQQDKVRGGPLYFAPPLPVGDLDRDGVADVLLFRPSGSSSGPEEPVLQAYSGKDGRRLWQYDPPHMYDENGNYGHPEGFSVSECRLLHCVDLNGDGRPDVVFAYGGSSRKGREFRLVILDGRTGKVRWQPVGFSGGTPDLVSQGTSGRVALVVENEEEFRALDAASGRTIRTWPRASEHPKELTSIPWPEDRSRAEFFRPSDLADVTCCRGRVPAEPLKFDFSLPLPWAERSPRRWLPALGAGLAYLALVGGFALARRWRLGLSLLAWMVVLPAVTMWWQFDEAHRLFAEERRDWAGWYWFWPDRLSCWAGWETLTNPLVGASAWFVLWVIVRRPWRSRTARTGG
jgi:hypothetical protein